MTVLCFTWSVWGINALRSGNASTTMNSKNKLSKPGNLKNSVSLVKPPLMSIKPDLDQIFAFLGQEKDKTKPQLS